MSNNDFLSNDLKYKTYLIFHVLVSLIFFAGLFAKKSDPLNFVYLIINLFLAVIVFYKSKYCNFFLNLYGVSMFVVLSYRLLQLIQGYVDALVIKYLLCYVIALMVLFIFYLIYLNSKNKLEEVEEVEEIGKFRNSTNN